MSGYVPNDWVDGVTPVDAARLNRLEAAVAAAPAALPAVVGYIAPDGLTQGHGFVVQRLSVGTFLVTLDRPMGYPVPMLTPTGTMLSVAAQINDGRSFAIYVTSGGTPADSGIHMIVMDAYAGATASTRPGDDELEAAPK
jgi:hypothetical protein